MKRHSKEEKAWLVEEWEASGKSKWAFTRELGLCYQSFSKWTREGKDEQNFVEIGRNLETEGPARGERTGCALVVEHGAFQVRLPAGSTAQDLAVVIRGLR
jgi:transposase-like protein